MLHTWIYSMFVCEFSVLRSLQSGIRCCSATCWWTNSSCSFPSLQVLPTSTTGACWERGTARWRWSWRTRRRWRRWWTGRSTRPGNTACSSASSASSTETSWVYLVVLSNKETYVAPPVTVGIFEKRLLLSCTVYCTSLFFHHYICFLLPSRLCLTSSQDHFGRSHRPLHRRVGPRQRPLLQGGLDGHCRSKRHHLPEGEPDITSPALLKLQNMLMFVGQILFSFCLTSSPSSLLANRNKSIKLIVWICAAAS